mgnify:CR=1 FL=1
MSRYPRLCDIHPVEHSQDECVDKLLEIDCLIHALLNGVELSSHDYILIEEAKKNIDRIFFDHGEGL